MESNGNEWNQLMLFAADTLASPSALPEPGKERTTPDTSGLVSPTPFGFFDLGSHCWKTSQATFQWDSEMFKPIWPRSGMTLNGIAYQRRPSAPLTAVIAYSSSLHETTEWTPTAKANQNSPSMRGRRLWPTPTAHLAKEGGYPAEGRRNEPSLTFQALNGQSGSLNPEWVEWLMGFPIGWTDLED